MPVEHMNVTMPDKYTFKEFEAETIELNYENSELLEQQAISDQKIYQLERELAKATKEYENLSEKFIERDQAL